MGFFLLEIKFTELSELYSGTHRVFNIYQNDHSRPFPFNCSLDSIFEEKVTNRFICNCIQTSATTVEF